MKAIISIWKTITDTLSVVGQYSHAYLYPLLSFAIMLLLTFTVMIPLLDRVVGLAHEAGPTRAFFFLVIFLALLDLMGLTMYSVLRICLVYAIRNTQY